MNTRRHLLAFAGSALGLGLAGCTAVRAPGVASPKASARESWSGRLALRVEGEASQSFAALFDLRGTAQRGTLTLTSPIGNTLAELRWTPTDAVLQNGNQVRRFDSVDALVIAATGAPVPVRALFAWLDGRDEQVTGWRPDLSQLGSGRLNAVRETPLPRAELRVIFDPS